MNSKREHFHAEAGRHWLGALAAATGLACPTSATWHGTYQIRSVLTPFMGNKGHVHLPGGGGHDFTDVQDAEELDCLSFTVDPSLAYILKPRSLTLQAFLDAPRESFFLLELDDLSAGGSHRGRTGVTEEVLELPGGHYVDRECWEEGTLGQNEHGQDIPLPPGSRPVVRLLSGKVLFVVKGSMWNATPATYDGRHNRMTAAEIRSAIERALARDDRGNGTGRIV